MFSANLGGAAPAANPAATDPPFQKVALLLNGDGNNGAQNNTFVDYSYPGGYAVSFDGTGDYLTVPSNSAFEFGTGDFTFECWFYIPSFPASGNYYALYDTRPASTNGAYTFLYFSNDTKIRLWVNSADRIASSSLTANTWYHLALCRSSGTTRMFVNGISQGTWSDTTNYIASNPLIGTSYGASPVLSQFLNGYISNLRIVKGTALYTSDFTPSTAPLTPVTGTSLLTCQSSVIVDNSPNKFAITKYGDAAVVDTNNFAKRKLSPFAADEGQWSNYFDGTGDYLDVPSDPSWALSGQFSIEAWVYNAGTQSNYPAIFSSGANSFQLGFNTSNSTFGVAQVSVGWTSVNSSYPPLNAWTHVLVTRDSSNVMRLFYNGVLKAYATVTTSFAQNAIRIGAQPSYGSFLGYISNARWINGSIPSGYQTSSTTVDAVIFTPPTSALTAISGTQLLTCQSNRFKDNSSNAFAITPSGDVAVNTFSPFSSYKAYSALADGASGWFNGSSDYLSAATGAGVQFGTGDFTVELWAYHTVSGANEMYCDQATSGFSLSKNTANKLALAQAGVAVLMTSTAAIPIAQWSHIAVTRSGTTVRMFINGSLDSSATLSTNFSQTGDLIIGRQSGAATWYANGYYSNFRAVKGTAVYTSAFTPPTAPLAPIANTSLLTCQTVYPVDASPNNFAITGYGNYATGPKQITRTGNVAQGTFSPFSLAEGQWSNYFDGTGDYLSITGGSSLTLDSVDFTIEGWVNIPSGQTTLGFCNFAPHATIAISLNRTGIGDTYIYIGNGSSWLATPAINSNSAGKNLSFDTWNHIALVRNGSTITLYHNGVSAGTTSFLPSGMNGNLYVGTLYTSSAVENYKGYISNFRIVKGTAVYTSNFTPSTTPLTAISGTSLLTCQSNRFKDNSSNNFTITPAGDTKVTAFSPFAPSAAYSASTNGGSGYFDGSGDYLSVADNSSLELGSSDFTIEAYFYLTVSTTASSIIAKRASGSVFGGYHLDINSGQLRFLADNDTGSPWALNMTSGTVLLNTWNHAAITRSGTSWKLWLNGTEISSATSSITVNDDTTSVGVGAIANGDQPFTGYISNVRIVKGTALYTANFTPPTAPLTAVSGTSLLLNCTNAGIIDNSGKNDIETVGNAQISTSVKKYGTGSMYFDGTGRLDSVLRPELDLSTGDFTVEFWFNVSSLPASGFVGPLVYNCATAADGASNVQFRIAVDPAGTLTARVYVGASAYGITTATISTGNWYHCALVRYGSTFTVYLNGSSSGTPITGMSNALNTNPAWLNRIGGYYQTSTGFQYLNGYIDDLRITKGIARYTANFTPPDSLPILL